MARNRKIRAEGADSGAFIELTSRVFWADKPANWQYTSEFYILSPKPLGINKSRYKASDFYKDLQTHIRLHLKTTSFEDLLKDNMAYFAELDRAIDAICRRAEHVGLENVYTGAEEDHIRICLKHIEHSLLTSRRDIIRALRMGQPAGEFCKTYINSCQKVMDKLKKWRYQVLGLDLSKLDPERMTLDKTLKVAEVFTGYCMLYHSSRIITSLIRHDPEYTSEKNQLALYLESVEQYMKNDLEVSIAEPGSKNKKFVLNYKAYKRYVNSVLFINSYEKKSKKVAEQIIYSFAAAVSMMVALIAYTWRDSVDNLSTSIIVFLIVAYIVRDRGKEWLKKSGKEWLTKIMWDNKHHLYHDYNKNIGSYTETVSYLKNYNALPKDVKELANTGSMLDFDIPIVREQYDVIKYQQNFTMNNRKAGVLNNVHSGESLFFINRLSASPFFAKGHRTGATWYKYDPYTNTNVKLDTLKRYNLIIIQKCYSGKDEKLEIFTKYRLPIVGDSFDTIAETEYHK